jgi:hypothetical protein
VLPAIREGSGGAGGLPGPHGGAPGSGAAAGGLPGVSARPGAERARAPAPYAWRGQPLSRLFDTARVAHGLRGLRLTRAWHSRDHVETLRPIFA